MQSEGESLALGRDPLTVDNRTDLAQVDGRYATYTGPDGIIEHYLWADALLDIDHSIPRLLLWDLHPLESNAWGSFLGFAESRVDAIRKAAAEGHTDSGDNIITMQRWYWREDVPELQRGSPEKPLYFSVDQHLDLSRFRPDGIRRCYIPTRYHVGLIRCLFPFRRRRMPQSSLEWLNVDLNPCAPPWEIIAIELQAADYDPDKLVSMMAPALIELLARVRQARNAADAAKAQAAVKADAESGPPSEASPCPTHSPDFTSVNWFGVRYTFTKGLQAESVRVLWEAWENGGHGLTQETIAECVHSVATRFELAKVFRRRKKGGGYQSHPAWGTVIQTESKGVYRLVPPDRAPRE